MATSAQPDLGETGIRNVRFDEDSLYLDLIDGRTVSAPLAWFPRLFDATSEQRLKFEIGGVGVHWPDVDEDLTARGLLQGRHDPERAAWQAAWRSPLLET